MRKARTFYSLADFGGNGSTIAWLTLAGLLLMPDPESADIIVFNGGEDIGTEIYGEKPVMGGVPYTPSKRDREEIALFDDYSGRRLLLGICRGAQLLNCLNGGKLWQHVDGHGRDHPMVDTRTGKTYQATSTHHQMMRPNMETGEIIGVASRSHIKHADDGVFTFKPQRLPDVGSEDVEIVWYQNTHSLCIQGHPEYVPGSDFGNYCLDLLDECARETALCAA